MPTYVYKFTDTGETIEVQQAFSDATLTEYPHPADGTVRSVKKVFLPIGVTFKGSGFYKTDSRGSSAKSSTGASTTSTSADTASTTTSTSTSDSSSSGSNSSGSNSSGASTPAASPSPASSGSAAAG